VLQALQNEAGRKPLNEHGINGYASDNVQYSDLSILWVGTIGGIEAVFVEEAGVPMKAIHAAGIHGVGITSMPGNLILLARGYREARQIVRDYKPHVLFFTGGYVAVPMAIAGKKIPSMLYVPDIEPGMALKGLARFADHIAVTAQESKTYFSGKSNITVTGYPTRSNLTRWNLAEARNALGLMEGVPTLLVFGGSKGARSINRALINVLPELLVDMQVVHITGELDWPEVQVSWREIVREAEANASWLDRYHAFPYLHEEMGAALTVADLALSRAGASTLGEFPLFALPAILVPYPHAWRYQEINAQYLANRGAALIIEDSKLPELLVRHVRKIIQDEERRRDMSQAMRTLAVPSAAQSILALLKDLAKTQTWDRM